MSKNKDIFDAIARGDLSYMTNFLHGDANLEVFDEKRRTPLMRAVLCGNSEIARMLLEKGANPNAKDSAGFCALHFASQDCQEQIVSLLLEFGAEVDNQDEFGNTPLWKAVFASRGRGEIIDLLLKSGANQDLNNANGVSPLKLARKISNYDIEKYFSK